MQIGLKSERFIADFESDPIIVLCNTNAEYTYIFFLCLLENFNIFFAYLINKIKMNQ